MKKSLGLIVLSALATEACAPSKKFSTQVESKNIVEETTKTIDAEPKPIPPSEAVTTIHFSNTTNGKQLKPYSIKPGALDITFEKNSVAAGVDTETIRPALDVTFVLDVTSSMGKQLDASKKGFKAFLDQLKADGFDARFSLFTFEDTVNLQSSLTDFDSFQTKLSKVSLGTGQDVAEASLLALQNALGDGATNKRMDAVPVIILVTDAVGHNGGGSTFSRDCSLDKSIMSFGSDYGKAAKFFYSVPSTRSIGSGSCYSDATNVMYDSLFTSISGQSKDPGEYRGQSLGWPFQEETLSTQLPKLLKEKITPKAISCLASKYRLSEGSQAIAEGNAEDWKLNASGLPSLSSIVSGSELEELVGKALKMEITRCCDDQKDAASCKNEKVQSIEFELKK